MDIRQKIKTLLQQADVYRAQGLLEEAKQSYIRAGQLAKSSPQLSGNKKVLMGLLRKLKGVKEEIERIDAAPTTVEMPKSVQDIIKDKFAFSDDEEKKQLEGAVMLAKFGQFSRALEEFEILIDNESMRLEAAKNIIRCHKVLENFTAAVSRYEEWFSGRLFTADQMNKLRIFLQDILDKKGMDIVLPKVEEQDEIPGLQMAGDEPAPEVETEAGPEPSGIEMPEEELRLVMESDEIEMAAPEPEPKPVKSPVEEEEVEEDEDGAIPAEDLIDISSVEITLDQGETVELDVSFQSGNVINLLIASKDEHLMEILKEGVKLNKLQFYSPIAMFNGKGVVSSAQVIESGPKQGDYSLDIQIKTV